MACWQVATILLIVVAWSCRCEEACYKDGSCDENTATFQRYLLYDVNPGEGFNLRRDVYSRVAAAVARLNRRGRWTLVLPPWGPLYHWQVTNGEYETGIPWSRFFDLSSMAKYVPVIEFEDYVKEHGAAADAVLRLQEYAEGWDDGRFDEKWDHRPCLREPRFRKSGDGYRALLWGEMEFSAGNFSCVSFQGTSRTLAEMLGSQPYRTVLLDRAEVVLHDGYGDAAFWEARRSVRFAGHLAAAAAALRRDRLRSDDAADRTEYAADWRQMKVRPGAARGGPYLAVHLRRRDFVSGRRRTVPSLEKAARDISAVLQRLQLDTVYLASDAPQSELRRLEELLKPFTVVRQRRAAGRLAGEQAVIDQIVCSHARHFIGSHESTFSFRIAEEREILGFAPETTFNRLCGDAEGDRCEQPTQWRVVYD